MERYQFLKGIENPEPKEDESEKFETKKKSIGKKLVNWFNKLTLSRLKKSKIETTSAGVLGKPKIKDKAPEAITDQESAGEYEKGADVVYEKQNWFVVQTAKNGELLEIRREGLDGKGRKIFVDKLVRADEVSGPIGEGMEDALVPDIENSIRAEKLNAKDSVAWQSEHGEVSAKIISIAGDSAEIGFEKTIERAGKKRTVYEREIVKLRELAPVSEEEGREQEESFWFNKEDLVSFKGEDGWQVLNDPEDGDQFIEIGRFRPNKAGRLVYAREIADIKDLEKME